MSARPLPATDATAFRIAALLEQYEQDVEDLESPWPDVELHARMSRDLDEMRVLCAAVPLLSVPWVHLMISNAEFLHCLRSGPAGGEPSVAARRCKGEHLVAIRALRERCLSNFTRVERSH